ncbi:MAG: mercury methylation ferredoxin HgcB [Syntrophobacteraceae bacterium]
MGKLVYLKDVVTLALDREKCTGCGMCGIVCPHAIFALSGGKAAIADRDSCMECGACALNCPAEAISVKTGVGCATAVINSMLGRKTTGCDCTIDQYDKVECGKSASGSGGCC